MNRGGQEVFASKHVSSCCACTFIQYKSVKEALRSWMRALSICEDTDYGTLGVCASDVAYYYKIGLQYYSRLTLLAEASGGEDAVAGASFLRSSSSCSSPILFADVDDDDGPAVAGAGAVAGTGALSGRGSAPTGSGTLATLSLRKSRVGVVYTALLRWYAVTFRLPFDCVSFAAAETMSAKKSSRALAVWRARELVNACSPATPHAQLQLTNDHGRSLCDLANVLVRLHHLLDPCYGKLGCIGSFPHRE